VDAVWLIVAVLFGLALGSFLNVCIVRLPRGESVVAPPSHCTHCQTPVLARDNLPIVSWVLLGGRCRACKAKISVRYPLVELASAILFAGCLLTFGVGAEGAGMAIFCWLLLGLALMDAETFLLPDAFTLPGIVLGVVYRGVLGHAFRPALLGAIAIGGVLLMVRMLYRLIRRREGMGFGDVKLGAMLGAWLGWQLGSVALFVAIVSGAVGGLVLAALHSRDANSTPGGAARIPFGSFLAAAGVMTVFCGEALLSWYLGFFSTH